MIQNPIKDDSLIVYILSHPYGNPSFKGVPDNIQLDKGRFQKKEKKVNGIFH